MFPLQQVLVDEQQKTIRAKLSYSIQRKEREIWHWVRYVLSFLLSLLGTHKTKVQRDGILSCISALSDSPLLRSYALCISVFFYTAVFFDITCLPSWCPFSLFLSLSSPCYLCPSLTLLAYFHHLFNHKQADLKFLFNVTRVVCNFTFLWMLQSE